MFSLEPNDVSKKLARKRVTVCEYPDGRLEVQHEGHVLPYRQFDKMRQVNQPAFLEHRHLDAALMLARQMQAIMPHHRKRNNAATRSEERREGKEVVSNGIPERAPTNTKKKLHK